LVLQPILAIKQTLKLGCTRNIVRNGVHGNLTNDVEIRRLNGVKQTIELLSDLKLDSNSPTQHPQEK